MPTLPKAGIKLASSGASSPFVDTRWLYWRRPGGCLGGAGLNSLREANLLRIEN